MFKFTALLALGFAAVSANFLTEDFRFLQSNVTTVTIGATCNRGSAESCGTGYCCSAVTRNGTAVTGTNTTVGICAPAEFNAQAFNLVGGNTNYTFSCFYNTTVTNLTASQVACSSANPCANTTTQCCAPRITTLGGVAGNATTRSTCIASNLYGTQLSANLTAGSINQVALITANCPVVDTTTSFGAYIKASAMMVVALIAAMFF